MSSDDPREGLAVVRERIAEAAARAGRDPAGVLLIAVSKGVAPSRIPPGLFTDLGENRVPELLEKQAAVADPGLRWHFLGTLQRNKAARIAGSVALIHSIDSRRLAEAVARAALRRGTVQEVLVQVNVGGEPTKHGVGSAEAVELALRVAAFRGLRLRGFMTMAPPADPQRARKCFAMLRTIRDQALGELPGAVELSMGMSGDFEEAVEEGSTMVRVGTAIFGERAAR